MPVKSERCEQCNLQSVCHEVSYEILAQIFFHRGEDEPVKHKCLLFASDADVRLLRNKG